MEAPEEDSFAASFSKGYGLSCGDPMRGTICVERGGFDVGFDCVVEDVGWLFPRDIVVVDRDEDCLCRRLIARLEEGGNLETSV